MLTHLCCCCLQAMLTWENVNCVAVEWKKAVRTQYVQAANNARVVSAQVVSMITFLKVTSESPSLTVPNPSERQRHFGEYCLLLSDSAEEQ